MAASDKEKRSDEETMRRMNEALKRALSMPHKPQSAYKVGRKKKQPAKKGA
jgi:hypothetical protein